MNVVLYSAQNFSSLFNQLQQNLLKKRQNIEEIFLAPLVFVNNGFAQSTLEELLLKENTEAPFVGNIHFLEWNSSLVSILEPQGDYFNSKTFSYFLGLFFYDLWKKGEYQNLFADLDDDNNVPSDFYSLGRYYYALFQEYEIYLPKWEQESNTYISPLHLDKLEFHKELYYLFWSWLEPILYQLYGTDIKRNSFNYPHCKQLKQQYQNLLDIHIFLPQMVIPSQLQLLKHVLAGKNIYIYVLESSALSKKIPDFYCKSKLLDMMRENCISLGIPLENVLLEKTEPLHQSIFINPVCLLCAPTQQQEYETTLGVLAENLSQEDTSMLNRYALILPKTKIDREVWDLTFSVYKEALPYHILYKQEKAKFYNSYDLIFIVLDFVKKRGSIEVLEQLLKQPLVRVRLEFTELEIEDFVRFLKSEGAWGENALFNLENTISYHLNRYLFSHILTPLQPMMVEIKTSLLEFCLDFFSEVQQVSLFQQQTNMTMLSLDKFRQFLEWLIPSSFWKELDDPYVRKDILDIYEVLDLAEDYSKKVLDNYIDASFLFKLFTDMNQTVLRGDDLAFAKKKGLIVGSLEDLDVFPMQNIFFTGFSEQMELFPTDLFHKESLLPQLLPELYQQMRWSFSHKLLEIFQESRQTQFSYSFQDKITSKELKPHILLDLLGKKELKTFKKPLYNSTLSPLDEKPTDNLGSKQTPKYEISDYEIHQFLKSPLEFFLKYQWGQSLFLEKEKQWNYLPYFFSLSSGIFRRQFQEDLYSHFYQNLLDQPGHFVESFPGLLSTTPYNREQMALAQKEMSVFLEQVTQNQKGSEIFYDKIMVGPYHSSSERILTVLPLHIREVSLLARLSFCYLQEETNSITITLPIFKSSNSDPYSVRKIISALIVGISQKKTGSIFIKILSPSKNKEEPLKTESYSYMVEEVYQYFSDLLPLMYGKVNHSLDLKNLQVFYKNNSFSGWGTDYTDALKNFVEEKKNENLLLSLFPPLYNQELTESLDKMYQGILEPLLGTQK